MSIPPPPMGPVVLTKPGYMYMLVPRELQTTIEKASECKDDKKAYAIPKEIECVAKMNFAKKSTYKVAESDSSKGLKSDPVIDPLNQAIKRYKKDPDEKIKKNIITTCLKLGVRNYLPPLHLLLYYYASMRDADSIIKLDMARVSDEYIEIPEGRKPTPADYKGKGVPDEYIDNIIEAFNTLYRQEENSGKNKPMNSSQVMSSPQVMTSPPQVINNSSMGGSYRKRKHNKTQRKRKHNKTQRKRKRDKRKRKTQRKR